jgi:hypothetical protein
LMVLTPQTLGKAAVDLTVRSTHLVVLMTKTSIINVDHSPIQFTDLIR